VKQSADSKPSRDSVSVFQCVTKDQTNDLETMRRAVLTLATCWTVVSAWTSPQNQVVTRQAFWQSAAAGVFAVVATSSPVEAETLPNGVTYEVKKKGDGPQPGIGELAAIRFAAYNGATKIDDIFDTPEPYYTRIGSGGLLKGVEETLPLMRLGDRWELTIPVS
jgi:FKBP-type peptidyl-prolyl cis-trans isomerase